MEEIDDFAEELEHQIFLAWCNVLVEEILWKMSNLNGASIYKQLWDEIDVFGDEPAFTSVLFDKLQEEDDECHS